MSLLSIHPRRLSSTALPTTYTYTPTQYILKSSFKCSIVESAVYSILTSAGETASKCRDRQAGRRGGFILHLLRTKCVFLHHHFFPLLLTIHVSLPSSSSSHPSSSSSHPSSCTSFNTSFHAIPEGGKSYHMVPTSLQKVLGLPNLTNTVDKGRR